MRTKSIKSIGYAPIQAPQDASQLPRFLFDELVKISAALNALAEGHLDETTVAPSKPRDGDIRFADGTRWNPGGGRGFYGYSSASRRWCKKYI